MYGLDRASYQSLQEQSTGLKWYQKTLLFSFLGGFPGWSIVLFAVATAVAPLVISMKVLDPPGAGDIVLDPKESYAAKMVLATTLANVSLTLLAMWVNVYKAAAGNSFSKSPEDWNTGSQATDSKLVAEDDGNARWSRIHGNLLENVPLTAILALAMLFCKPSDGAVQWFIVPYPIIRLVHMIWYSIAGSHEVRAMLFTGGLFCNFGCLAQCIIYIADLS